MSDESSERVETSVDLRLSDSLSLQNWLWRQNFVRHVVLIGVVFIAVTYALSLVTGASASGTFHQVIRDWIFYALFLLGVLVFTLIVRLAAAFVGWLRSGGARHMQIVADGEGVRASFGSTELHSKWEGVRTVSENRWAYFVRGKILILRLPKRAFDGPQRRTFEALVRANVSGPANRLRSPPPQTP